MTRILVTIMIVFMSVAPTVHSYLAFKLNAIQTLVAEEETHEEKPAGKIKFDSKENYFSSFSFHQHNAADLLKASHLHYLIFLSKGYAGPPFRPPDMI